MEYNIIEKEVEKVEFNNCICYKLTYYGMSEYDFNNFVLRYNFMANNGVNLPDIYLIDVKNTTLLINNLGEKTLSSQKNNIYSHLNKVIHIILIMKNLNVIEYDFMKMDYMCMQKRFMFAFEVINRLMLDNNENLIDYFFDFSKISEKLDSFPKYLSHNDFRCHNLIIYCEEIFLIDFDTFCEATCYYDLSSFLDDPSLNLSVKEKKYILYKLNSLDKHRKMEYETFIREFNICAFYNNFYSLATYLLLKEKRRTSNTTAQFELFIEISINNLLHYVSAIDNGLLSNLISKIERRLGMMK